LKEQKLRTQIEDLFDAPPTHYTAEHFAIFQKFKDALNAGKLRAAVPDQASPGGWRAELWIKKGLLLGFRMGHLENMSVDTRRQPFFDKSTYPPREVNVGDVIRIIPGGSSIRDASYVARGVICAPPMFINIGAYVDENTLIDSHALVGSCAQIGKRCHISAGAQIGGVLEPIGAMPVVIEDEVMVGGNSGVYEGTIVKRRAVLGTGTILNRSIPVYDLVRDEIYTAAENSPLLIPEAAIVVPGSRAAAHPNAAKWGLSLQCAVIVKYRDEKTDARVTLEDILR
jgi:2,3,4,5-tetrahydropyridine-2,6-dicarboxylate N-succinyltransferase